MRAGAAAHGDPYRGADLALRNRRLHAIEDLLRGRLVTRYDAAILGEATEVSRGKAKPSPGGQLGGARIEVEALESQRVELGQPDRRCRFRGPGYDGALGRRRDEFDAPGMGLKLRRETRQAGESVGHEVGLKASFLHFAFNGLRFARDADGHRLALAKLVLENSQCFIEGGDHEVGDAVANCAPLSGWI